MSASFSLSRKSDKTKSIAPQKSASIVFWAWIGVVFILAELVIWFSWVSGPHFTPTDPGPDPISKAELWYLYGVQFVAMSLAIVGMWYWVIRPWVRDGKMSTDGMLAICCWTMVFWDPSMNYTVTTVLYNSHAVNMGAWTLGSWPGWTSPNGHLLPEPLLVTVPGYLCFVYFMVAFPCWLVHKLKSRYPQIGLVTMVGALIIGVLLTDTLIEILLLRTGIYAYPAGIREFTLFAGQTYQFPLTEALTFGGACAVVALLKFFTNDKGQTFVERGTEQSKFSDRGRQALKFLALFGFTHLAFMLVYAIPNQWLGTHGDPYPEGYPSYMLNDMCKYGDARDQCPGPGISMPRPENNPW